MDRQTSLVYPVYIAIILCLAQAMSIVDRYLVAAALEPLRQDLQLSDTPRLSCSDWRDAVWSAADSMIPACPRSKVALA